ncbi:hypothetical protein CCMA1212_001927 [Trichoderma ghanense]|uniref:Uncharacterized protein n=1 Tax=Trichoderma ghanense TaxID=65468 RepID=A0ABY2HBR0_9HYPO
MRAAPRSEALLARRFAVLGVAECASQGPRMYMYILGFATNTTFAAGRTKARTGRTCIQYESQPEDDFPTTQSTKSDLLLMENGPRCEEPSTCYQSPYCHIEPAADKCQKRLLPTHIPHALRLAHSPSSGGALLVLGQSIRSVTAASAAPPRACAFTQYIVEQAVRPSDCSSDGVSCVVFVVVNHVHLGIAWVAAGLVKAPDSHIAAAAAAAAT